MTYETIADIYSAREKVRVVLTDTVSSISLDEAIALPDGEKWSIQHLVEHLAMVDNGISRICAKLVEEAKAIGKPSDGAVKTSTTFNEKAAVVDTVKVEAPERVQPTGNVTIAEALERMNANQAAYDAMRSDLESCDVSDPKFPHPYFGDITAIEWLIVTVGHEDRHTKQIQGLLEKIRQ